MAKMFQWRERLDWGLVNSAGTGGFTGVQCGFVNIDEGNVVLIWFPT